jgi:hypothetical protein
MTRSLTDLTYMRKAEITVAVAELLSSLSDDSERQFARSALETLLGSQVVTTRPHATGSKTDPQPKAKGQSVTKPQPPAVSSERKPEALVSLRDSPDLLKIMRDPLLASSRQPGAQRPRMDKKSVRTRWAKVRQELRKLLQSNVPNDEKSFGVVNALKSLRLQASDCVAAGVEPTLQGSLISLIPPLERINAMYASALAYGAVEDGHTGFLADPGGVFRNLRVSTSAAVAGKEGESGGGESKLDPFATVLATPTPSTK